MEEMIEDILDVVLHVLVMVFITIVSMWASLALMALTNSVIPSFLILIATIALLIYYILRIAR